MGLLPLRVLILALPLAQVACVDNAVQDQTVEKLEEARRALAVKDNTIQAYQWQLATLVQQVHEAQARNDAREKELLVQIRELSAASASLGERLKKVESDRAALILASSADPNGAARDAKQGVRPEELRRMIATADARNALVLEELARIERLLGGGAGAPALPAASTSSRWGARPQTPAPRPADPPPADVLDPWGFGSRK